MAYCDLGKACANAGPLSDRERRLVKLALAIGAALEGAIHSHTRRARAEGIENAALDQVALLAKRWSESSDDRMGCSAT
ncbi:carboxymuconolactone decarboxylase family protein [Cochlodiniinecator piscidefendens]|uniref:carboxymuconolactone decarboxylase family protein n=1 Tax=Cochlodiniinecator piscidefendens TaxID=2715756 RepID=UPI001446B9D8